MIFETWLKKVEEEEGMSLVELIQEYSDARDIENILKSTFEAGQQLGDKNER